MASPPVEFLLALDYPEELTTDEDNVLTKATFVGFQAAGEYDSTLGPRWWVVNNIADMLPYDARLNDESRNYQRGVAAGIALAILASAA